MPRLAPSRCVSKRRGVACFKDDGHFDEHAGIADGGCAVYWPNEPEAWISLNDLALMLGVGLAEATEGVDKFVAAGYCEWSDDRLAVRMDRSIIEYTTRLFENDPEAGYASVDRVFTRGHRFGLLEGDPDEFKDWIKDEGVA